jgi:hypothetical protein
MAGMIPHHAQAVVMAGWAPSHGARPDVRVLCERILVGQRDEIEFMRTWLRDRGETVYELLASLISQNELDAANTVHFHYLNAQGQRKIVWPPSFAKARAYLDQLERSNGLATAKISAAREGLTSAEALSGDQRQQALERLATR